MLEETATAIKPTALRLAIESYYSNESYPVDYAYLELDQTRIESYLALMSQAKALQATNPDLISVSYQNDAPVHFSEKINPQIRLCFESELNYLYADSAASSKSLSCTPPCVDHIFEVEDSLQLKLLLSEDEPYFIYKSDLPLIGDPEKQDEITVGRVTIIVDPVSSTSTIHWEGYLSSGPAAEFWTSELSGSDLEKLLEKLNQAHEDLDT